MMFATRRSWRWIAACAVVLVALAGAWLAWRSPLLAAVASRRAALVAEQGANHADDVAYWTCPMHTDVREHEPGKCPKCGMTLVPVAQKDAKAPASSQSQPASMPMADAKSSAKSAESMATAQPASASPQPAPTVDGAVARGDVTIDPRRQQLIGVRTVRVERTKLGRSVRTVGLVRYDETRQADINLKVEAWIRSLNVNYTGRFVRKGEPLFTVYSPDLLSTQQEYALALKSREQFSQSQIADSRVYADRLVDSARQRLALWDLSADQIRALEQGRQPEASVVFRSPVSGFVVEKRAVEGLHVMPGESLYKVVDLSVVWVEADVYEQELAMVRRGAAATVTLDAYPDATFRGRVAYIYPFVEEKTRTVKVRFEFPNRDGRLKPGMYANVELSSPQRDGLAVPANAVLDSGVDRIVFVAQGDGYFQPRHVTLGQRLGDTIEIREGLTEGEEVATGATFFLDSESQLRASLQGYEPLPARHTAAGPTEKTQITLRSRPDPARVGENQFEVEVKGSDGKPVADAEVTVAFYMAAMPTMNMPAMRNEARLPAAGNGVYRGTANVMMAGRWDVSVIVTRNGQRIGTKQTTVVAR